MSVSTAFSAQFADLRAGWRALLATSLGLSSGMAIHPFVMNVLAPHVVSGMGWSKADFALAAMVSGLAIFSYPVVGRLADRFGVRRTGAVGIAATVLSYLAIAALDGPVGYYVAILILQLTLGAMTTGPVFLRMVIAAFDRSRGLALAIAVSAPALVAALASPLLAALIEVAGWRTGSLAVAAYSLLVGALALALVPGAAGKTSAGGPTETAGESPAGVGFRALFASRAYRILIATTILVSLPLVLTQSQLSLVLIDNGMSMSAAGSIVGLFAVGTIIGRLLAGLALDRFPAEYVGAIAFCLPAVGMLLLAAPWDTTPVLAAAIILMGLAFGAEGDVLAYMVSRYFDLASYGTALGTLFAAVGISAMLGALLLSQSLRLWQGYTLFLLVASVSVLAGCLLLLGLRRAHPVGSSNPAEDSIAAIGEHQGGVADL
ncbi:MFS transporter [Haliea sp. E17]|uniref:MFS transporter n=1 Tax=Haliea sp. E17 TaxID=3401576 RepID=UPI003AAF9364